MRALTVRQPWASLIMAGIKDVENRTWRPPAWLLGQRIWIHAAKAVAMLQWPGQQVQDLPRGVILGSVVLAGVVTRVDEQTAQYQGDIGPWPEIMSNPWYTGDVGWVLRDPRLLPEPVPAKGQLGLWTPKCHLNYPVGA